MGREALETLYPKRLEEYYEMLAYHYVRSGNKDKAVEYLDLANQKAAKANAMGRPTPILLRPCSSSIPCQ